MIKALISLEGSNLQPENCPRATGQQSLVEKTSQIEIKYRIIVKTKSTTNEKLEVFKKWKPLVFMHYYL